MCPVLGHHAQYSDRPVPVVRHPFKPIFRPGNQSKTLSYYVQDLYFIITKVGVDSCSCFPITKGSKSGLKIPQNRVKLEMIWGIPRWQVL